MTRSAILRLGLSLVLLGVALLALQSQLGSIDPGEVASHIRSIPGWRIGAAACVTAANYLQLTFYDVIGLRYVKRKLHYSSVAPASFVAIAFSHNIGPSILSGGSIRYRFYSARGLSAGDIARIIGFVSITFALGYAWMAGVMLSTASDTTKLPIPTNITRMLGIVLLMLACTYITLSAAGLKRISFGRRHLAFPKLRLALSQVCVASIDWLSMALVLSLLLPISLGGYWNILRMLLIAQIAGMLSQVPGGLGVFESLMVASLGTTIPVATLLGTLVVYRLVYNIVPFVVAIIGLAFYELRRRGGAESSSHRISRVAD